MSKVEIYFDGASRNNPGPSGAGGMIIENGKVIKEYYRYLGKRTNNEAEYLAVLLGIKILKRLKIRPTNLDLIGDSKLIIEQLAGRFKIKNGRLKKLHRQVEDEIKEIETKIRFKHIGRAGNSQADKLANKAIDEKR